MTGNIIFFSIRENMSVYNFCSISRRITFNINKIFCNVDSFACRGKKYGVVVDKNFIHLQPMPVKNDSALKVAEFLLQIKAVKLQPFQPFTWASGLKSPIYCDNRITLSYPNIRTYIRQNLAKLVSDNFPKPDAIVGVATGGIAQGALVAQDLGLPFAYVRSEAKGHGMKNLVEGHLEPGQTVVLVEDLVSTGKSSLAAVEALQEAGLVVKGMVAIFTYGFNESKDAFDKKNIKLVTLTDYNILVEQALKSEYIKKEEVETLKKWRENPKEWSLKILA